MRTELAPETQTSRNYSQHGVWDDLPNWEDEEEGKETEIPDPATRELSIQIALGEIPSPLVSVFLICTLRFLGFVL